MGKSKGGAIKAQQHETIVTAGCREQLQGYNRIQ